MKVAIFRLLFFHCMAASSLIIHTANQQYHFTSHYSTIGFQNARQQRHHITLLYASNITSGCKFSDESIATFTKDSLLVIYGSLPNYPSCASDVYGRHTAVARLAQANGFVGIITQSEEMFYDGRIVGFDASVSIPYVLVSSRTIQVIFAFDISMITGIELPPISAKDAHDLRAIKIVYLFWRAIGGVLYGSLIFIIGYVLWAEKFVFRKKIQWQSFFVKLLALVNSLCGFLWISIDPFGFYGMTIPSAGIIGFATGCFFCIFMLLLQIWTLSVWRLGTKYSSWISRAMYSLSATMMAASIFQGVFWFIIPLRYALFSFVGLCLMLSGLGFFATGKKMIFILRNSKNMSADQRSLTKKISTFVTFYLITVSCSSVIRVANALGFVVSVMASFILSGFIILATFLVLFLPAVLKQQPWSNVDSDPNLETGATPQKDDSSPTAEV